MRPTTGQELRELATGGHLDGHLAISGDGSLLVLAGSVDGPAAPQAEYRIVSLKTGDVRTLRLADEYVTGVALARDGSLLPVATAGETPSASLRLFRTEDANVLRELSGCVGGADTVALDVAGTRVAVTCLSDGEWILAPGLLCDVATGQQQGDLSGGFASAESVALRSRGCCTSPSSSCRPCRGGSADCA